MNLIEQIEQEQIQKLADERSVPIFAPGDTLRVMVKVVEGSRERLQAFEGVCIARRNKSIGSSFTVRKISYGEGVERVFPLYSPIIASVEVVRRGDVRRAKLYFLRELRGKRARIAEKTDGFSAKVSAEEKAAIAAAKDADRKARLEANEAANTDKQTAKAEKKAARADKQAKKRK